MQSFATETRAKKMRSIVAAHQKLTTTNCGQSLKLILLQLQEKLLKNLTSTILWSFSIWMKLEGWKSSVSGCLMSWLETRKKKSSFLKCHLLLFYATTMSHFWIGLWRITKSGFYMTTSNDQLSGWTEKKLPSTSRSQLHQKRSPSLFGDSLPIWSTRASWIQRNHHI